MSTDHIRAPIRQAVDPDGAESSGVLSVRIRNEVEREAVLLPKLPVRRLALHAYAQNDCPRLPEGVRIVSESAGLSGASQRVVPRIEIEHDRGASQGAEPDLGSVPIR